ncbi:MAG TPA: hypothetical protein PLR99_04205 [Polyangiaceae bacterium]|nr:hypothetical protein [Polyangiaceae bacterium]
MSRALAARVWLFALALAATSLGCGAGIGVCTSVCSRQYSDCVARSSPGASQSDCAAREQQCSAQCKEKR